MKSENQTEYVGFTSFEKGYSQKNFLQVQLELLNSIQRFKIYKKLRKDELVLKIALKNKIAEVLERLEKLEKILPKSSLTDSGEIKGNAVRKSSVEREIDGIRRKLEKLRH